MTKILVADLREDQDCVSLFMIRARNLRSFRERSGSLLTLRLGDRSGEIDAKVWDDAERWYERLKTDAVVKIGGRAQLYNGRLELNVNRIRLAREDEYSIEDFLPVSPRDRAEMLDELEMTISQVADPHLARLVRALLSGDVKRDFTLAPAAKTIHHACLGGLLQHTLEVVRLCRTPLELYPAVNRDLVIAGALLHDIGKVREYRYRRSIDFSDAGRLLGHIILGEEMIVAEARQMAGFPEELLLRLRHMVVSHHGQYQWQSPKRPKTLEAAILHLADYSSGELALVDSWMKASAGAEAAWTDYNRHLERALFLGEAPLVDDDSEERENARRVMEWSHESYQDSLF